MHYPQNNTVGIHKIIMAEKPPGKVKMEVCTSD